MATHYIVRNPHAVFGALFRRARELHGLTQEDVLDRLVQGRQSHLDKKSASWVSRVESGDICKLDRATVVALCEAIGLSRAERLPLLLAAGFHHFAIPRLDSAEAYERHYRALADDFPPDRPDAPDR